MDDARRDEALARQRAQAALEEVFEVSGHRPDDDALTRARAMVVAGRDWQRERRQRLDDGPE